MKQTDKQRETLDLSSSNEKKIKFSPTLSYLTTAFDMIPMLVSAGGIEECPPDV